MLKQVTNDVLVVVFTLTILATLSVNALQRSQQAQIPEANISTCHNPHCHAMNPGHWL